MDDLSSTAKRLLKEIIKYDSDKKHFEDYFNLFYDWSKSKYKSEEILRSAFEELKDAKMIDISWSDDGPDNLSVTSKGISYLDEKRRKNIVSTIKWIIATIITIYSIFKK